MLTIRMARVGKRNKAQFKIMLQEKTAAPGGRHIEILGSHDPHLKQTVLKDDRIKYWLSKGAQASDTVHNLLVSKGVITDKKRPVKLPKKPVEAAPAEASAETEKTEVTEESKAEEKPAEAQIEIKAEEKQEEKKEEEK